jgi:hypothetical protein
MDTPSQIPQKIVDRLTRVVERLDVVERDKTKDRWWDVAVKFMVPLVLGAAGASINHELRISKLEDGGMLIREFMQDTMRELKANQAEMRVNQQNILQRLRELEVKSGK